MQLEAFCGNQHKVKETELFLFYHSHINSAVKKVGDKDKVILGVRLKKTHTLCVATTGFSNVFVSNTQSKNGRD